MSNLISSKLGIDGNSLVVALVATSVIKLSVFVRFKDALKSQKWFNNIGFSRAGKCDDRKANLKKNPEWENKGDT